MTTSFIVVCLAMNIGGDDLRLLAKKLTAENSMQRVEAAKGVYDVAVQSPERAATLVPDILQRLDDSDDDVRLYAFSVLTAIGRHLRAHAMEAAPKLVVGLNEEKTSIAMQAAKALQNIGKPAVSRIVKGLEKNTISRRSLAIQVLGWIGNDAKEAIPVVENILMESPGLNQSTFFTAEALLRIDPKNEEGGRRMVQFFEQPSSGFQQDAAELLARTEKHKKLPATFLVKAVEGETPYVTRVRSLIALWQIGEDSGFMEPILQDLVKQASETSGESAALVIAVASKVVPNDKKARSGLVQRRDDFVTMLDNKEIVMRLIAVDALARIKAEAGLKKLKRLAEADDSPAVRAEAARAIKVIQEAK
jgi:HEAT repeat protein